MWNGDKAAATELGSVRHFQRERERDGVRERTEEQGRERRRGPPPYPHARVQQAERVEQVRPRELRDHVPGSLQAEVGDDPGTFFLFICCN